MDHATSVEPVWRGHSVLQLPVAALESFVRERTAYYDPGFLVTDPGFIHAHITALVPFRDEFTESDDATIAAICARTAPIPVELNRIEVTGNGLIQLLPEPDTALRTLSARLQEAFTDCVPYWGRYGEVAPHLTLDAVSAEVDVDWVRARLAGTIPLRVTLDQLHLVWYESGRCRLMRRWPLG